MVQGEGEMSEPQKPRWTKGVLLVDYTTPATTWRVGHFVPAGSRVLVLWAPDRERARVFEVVPWGSRPLFSVPLKLAAQYVKSTR